MILLAALCTLGLIAGALLLVRVPLCDQASTSSSAPLSIIIPAHNEEQNLPRLLDSLVAASTNSRVEGDGLQPVRRTTGNDEALASEGARQQSHPSFVAQPQSTLEVLVVDDHSTDDTAAIARAHHARVIPAAPLAPGWTGKNSACLTGASHAHNDLLLFLDADTWFAPHGLENLRHTFSAQPQLCALSVLPFHETRHPYEQLSLFFNLLMAIGAGGFGALGRGRLFGQSLLLPRELYTLAGTHAAVRAEILENFALAPHIEAAGATCITRGGRGVLHMRMFPNGYAQLCEGWTKAFTHGASGSSDLVLAVSIFWLTALCITFLWLVLAGSLTAHLVALAFYLAYALQLAWMARQIGAFRWLTFLLYPLPLIFFFAVFARALSRRVRKQPVAWRGRQL